MTKSQLRLKSIKNRIENTKSKMNRLLKFYEKGEEENVR